MIEKDSDTATYHQDNKTRGPSLTLGAETCKATSLLKKFVENPKTISYPYLILTAKHCERFGELETNVIHWLKDQKVNSSKANEADDLQVSAAPY